MNDPLTFVPFVLAFVGVMGWLWTRRPRDEFASAELRGGEPFRLEHAIPEGYRSVSVWVQIDMDYPADQRISGSIEVLAGGQSVVRERLALGHGRRIIEGPPSGFRHAWTNMQVGETWRIRGHIRLVRLSGSALRGPIVVEGTPEFGPGVRPKLARVYLCR